MKLVAKYCIILSLFELCCRPLSHRHRSLHIAHSVCSFLLKFYENWNKLEEATDSRTLLLRRIELNLIEL